MVDKRLMRLAALKREAVAPVRTGPAESRVLVVGWGSTAPIIGEALAAIGRQDVAQLHFPQVYPVAPGVTDLLKRAETLIVVEGNATAQFARLLRTETGVEIPRRILKYNGLSFTVEELAARIEEALKEEGK
jgi:2-oxoglutarate ferredoxin oxidoreductase subunit alpha